MNDRVITVRIAKDLSGSKLNDPAGLARHLLAVMRAQNEMTANHIIERYESFPQNEPTTMEGLRTISGLLLQNTRAGDSYYDDSNYNLSGPIGNVTEYAAIHEFGGIIQRVSLPGSVRLRTDAKGELLRQHGRLAVFAARRHRRVLNVPFHGGKHYDINIPARAPIQRGIEDRLPDYAAAIENAIGQYLN